MHNLPPDLEEALKHYNDPYDRRPGDPDVLPDWEPILQVLRELHALHPDWRFGQMVANLASLAGESQPGNVYNVPDIRLVKTAREYLAHRRTAHRHHSRSKL